MFSGHISVDSIVFVLLIAGSSYIVSAFNTGHSAMFHLPRPAQRIKNESESVFVEFNQLALKNKPLDLGQGFPDFAAPQFVVDSLHSATNQSDPRMWINNQYARSFGHPGLIKALVEYYHDFRSFKQLDEPNEQVVVTVGAMEALYTTIMAFVEPGDEVLIVEPAFDSYVPMVRMAQATSVFVPLRLRNNNGSQVNETQTAKIRSEDYELNMTEFRQKVTPRTRMLILNTPNNPLGKVYSLSELQEIAKVCIENNILVLADEVYEQMYYGGRNQHLSIAQLPGMWDRTVTVGSAGKTFSVTGWKIGWALGPKHLIRYVQLMHQIAVYTVARPLQEAVARAFQHEVSLLKGGQHQVTYWDELRADLLAKRERMANILVKANMRPIVPQGGYFMLVDFSQLAKQFPQYKVEGQAPGRENTNDFMFARWLSASKKLQGIPASAFYYDNKPLAANLVRFCFIKQWQTLDQLESLIGKLTTGGQMDEQEPAGGGSSNNGAQNTESQIGAIGSSSSTSSPSPSLGVSHLKRSKL